MLLSTRIPRPGSRVPDPASRIPRPGSRVPRPTSRVPRPASRPPHPVSLARYDLRVMTTFPEWVEPMAATLTQERFTGPEWIFERKFDGIRLLAFKRARRPPAVAQPAARRHSRPSPRPWRGCRPRRHPRRRGRRGSRSAAYHVFDVLWLDGRDVTMLPLEERRALLAAAARCAARTASTLIDDDQPVGARRAARAGRA